MNQQASKAAFSAKPFAAGRLGAALAGAGGGLLSFPVGEIVGRFADGNGGASIMNILGLLFGAALWSGAIGLTMGAAILVYDNLRSLRGQWHRDLLLALPLFFVLSFAGGATGQISYLLVQNSLTRGIGWALMGMAIGAGLGLVRRDWLQAARGALGGALGGFIGGFIFNGLAAISDAGGGSFSRLIGQIIMGALIALLMRVVQDALKSAWLLGVSAGPYEGKEYALNTARVSVGRDQSNAIALFREESLPRALGALVFQNQHWFWQGQAIEINGIALQNAPLNAGDTLQIGATKFRFLARSAKSATPPAQPTAAAPSPAASAPPPALVAANADAPPPMIVRPPTATPPIAAPTNRPPTAKSPAIASPIIAPTTTPPPPAATPPGLDASPTVRPQIRASVRATTPATMPAFALLSSAGKRLAIPPCEQAITLGRGEDNAITVADESVSARHARLQWRGGALEFTDLGSTNGSFVNDEKLAPRVARRLQIGDRLRLGQSDFTLRV